MSKPVARVMPFSAGPSPTVMARRKRSLVSITRRQVTAAGSMSSRANLQSRQEAVTNVGFEMRVFNQRATRNLNAQLFENPPKNP
jgi:hypothetical protein